MEPTASGWVCWRWGRWAWNRRCPSVEGSGDLYHQGGRTDENPEQPSSPPLAQLPTASTGPGLPGGSGQRSRPGRGWVGPRLGGRAVPVHPGRPCSHRWAIVVSTEALALGGNECNQASHPWRICGAGGWQATQKPSESFSTQVYRNAVYFVGDVGSVNYAAGTA